MTSVSLEDIQAAAQRIAPYIHRTPLLHSNTLSRMTGHEVYLKAELFQKAGSYKPRGMLNRLMQMSDRERAAGAITFSAGNAAQGLAYAGGIVGVKTTVVMPESASPAKAQATRDYGGEVMMMGGPAECLDLCLQLVEERGMTFISSYDDIVLMTGHASLGLEIVKDMEGVDAIFAGIGGGGMAGGLGLAMSALGHHARLIGVEPVGAPAMYESLKTGAPVKLETVNTIADGLAAPSAGAISFEIVRERFEDVLLVEDQQIADAMALLMSRCKLFAEPAGSAALAGLLGNQVDLAPDSKIVVLVSGGNIDFDRLARIIKDFSLG
ncbi:MAG: pyridoxal-phosphate dependent enzyme [Fimbriimonadaceae bacterium]|nr:pyridoxal-phosphate dependent enzyme [Alphaproteobacteria bacterium]